MEKFEEEEKHTQPENIVETVVLVFGAEKGLGVGGDAVGQDLGVVGGGLGGGGGYDLLFDEDRRGGAVLRG